MKEFYEPECMPIRYNHAELQTYKEMHTCIYECWIPRNTSLVYGSYYIQK